MSWSSALISDVRLQGATPAKKSGVVGFGNAWNCSDGIVSGLPHGMAKSQANGNGEAAEQRKWRSRREWCEAKEWFQLEIDNDDVTDNAKKVQHPEG